MNDSPYEQRRRLVNHPYPDDEFRKHDDPPQAPKPFRGLAVNVIVLGILVSPFLLMWYTQYDPKLIPPKLDILQRHVQRVGDVNTKLNKEVKALRQDLDWLTKATRQCRKDHDPTTAARE